jgi:hypothetical protein
MAKRRRAYWNENFPACGNCGTVDYSRRDRGYCALCFPWDERLRLIASWDIKNVRTWKGCSFPSGMIEPLMTKAEYVKACRDLCKQELHTLKIDEARGRGDEPVEGLDIEHKLVRLAEVLKLSNRDQFHGIAGPFDHTLDDTAQRLVYDSLAKLLALRPPRSSVWARAFSKVLRDKRRAEERAQRADLSLDD